VGSPRFHDAVMKNSDSSHLDIEDGRVIARLQRLTAELLADRRSGQWRAETLDEIYRARLELERRVLNSCRQHRDAIIRADAQAWWLIEWAKITAPALRPTDGRP
jgi:hypothetical protein